MSFTGYEEVSRRKPTDMTEDLFVVEGGVRLEGTVKVSGAKNAALAIIPAALLSDNICHIENLPEVNDVHIAREIMSGLGALMTGDCNRMTIDSRNLSGYQALDPIMQKMRASYYTLGVLLSRFGRAEIALPGGCDIGVRAIDQHIKGMKALGAKVTLDDRTLVAVAENGLHGAEVLLDVYSVGATINIMLASVMARGNTTIVNAAKEPNVVDLANFLNSMGAHVRGAGTDIMRIKGVEKLHGCTYTIIPDQIETGTLMIATAATRGDVVIQGVIPAHIEAVTAKLLEIGVRVDEGDDMIRVRSEGALRGVNIKTLPYPGFPTDLQQPMGALLSIARGQSSITENIFESRFAYISELQRMGAKCKVIDRIATIDGVPLLYGTAVTATDLRAGAALVVASMIAEGTTEIRNVKYIDRGYVRIEEKLQMLGARIRRVSVPVVSPSNSADCAI